MTPANGLLWARGPSQRRTFFLGPCPGPADCSGRVKVRGAAAKGLRVQTQTDTLGWVTPQVATREPRGSACPISSSAAAPTSALHAQGLLTAQVQKTLLSPERPSQNSSSSLQTVTATSLLGGGRAGPNLPLPLESHLKMVGSILRFSQSSAGTGGQAAATRAGKPKANFPLAPGTRRNSRSFLGN